MGHSLIHLHRLLVCLIRTACFARALRCAHSFAHALTHSLLSSWSSGIVLSHFQGVLNHCAKVRKKSLRMNGEKAKGSSHFCQPKDFFPHWILFINSDSSHESKIRSPIAHDPVSLTRTTMAQNSLILGQKKNTLSHELKSERSKRSERKSE